MTFIVNGEILVDGSDAKSAITSLRAENAKLVQSVDGVNKSTTAWQRGVTGVRTRLASTRSSVSNWIGGMKQIDESQTLAGGSVANLAAQFNDVAVTIAAGQDPRQIALQQGTQIAQVYGNRGVAAALGATRQALVSMLSPLNLITIGSIAAGAAAVQWLSSSEEDGRSFEERLESMSNAVEVFGQKQKEAFQSSENLIEQFGSASPALRSVLADLALFAKRDAQKEIDGIAASVRDLVLELSFFDDRTSQSAAQDFLGLSSISRSARQAGAEFANNLELLEKSQDPAEKLRIAVDIRETLLDAAGGLDNLNTQQEEFYFGLAKLISQLEVFGARIREPWDDLKKTANEFWTETSAHLQEYLQDRLEIDASARATIAQLELEAEIYDAIKQHGEESVEVAALRLEGERRVFQQRVEELEITELFKKEMVAAWDAANGVASVDIHGNISLAADEAHRLKQNLLQAKGAALVERIDANPGFYDPRGESQGAGRTDFTYQDQSLPPVTLPPNPTNRSTSGSARGVSELKREKEAIEDLLQSQRLQLEVLRETDPVLQEMLGHRNVLASATDTQRSALEALIRERINEQSALDQTAEKSEFLKDTMGDVAGALIAGGDGAADAWRNVAASIAEAVLQAALLGEGPLTGLFGGSSDGGFLSALFPTQARADGGIITGMGGDRSDQEIVLASPGEFFVNAKATRKHRHLLEAINAGAVPAFADGGSLSGSVAPVASASATGGANSMNTLRIEPSDMFKVRMIEVSQDMAVEVVKSYDQQHLGASIDRNVNDPRSVG